MYMFKDLVFIHNYKKYLLLLLLLFYVFVFSWLFEMKNEKKSP